MAWRDRLRRRAAATPVAAASGTASAAAAAAPAVGMPAVGVPGDWDGGWRRTAPPVLTVSRAPMGVSDGLAFRAGLAAWRDPSFDTGLAHALLPTAPAGLVRGVARPATADPTHTGGGPLLLRALRRPDEAEAAPGEQTPFEPVRRSGAAAVARATARGGPAATEPAASRSPSRGRAVRGSA
ncbi:hypothetical protein ACWGIP_27660, partial [Streptomyces sp. NPDC054838]